jgi:hypothetical protein
MDFSGGDPGHGIDLEHRSIRRPKPPVACRAPHTRSKDAPFFEQGVLVAKIYPINRCPDTFGVPLRARASGFVEPRASTWRCSRPSRTRSSAATRTP